MSEEAPAQQFQIQKIYTKDISFESPNAPEIFSTQNFNPEINVQINTANKALGEDNHEVVLTLTITAKQEDKTAYLVEVKQAGVFTISGFDEASMGGMLGAFCPETLFSFAREAISDLVLKGGYAQLLLQPINFNALYQQHMQQKAPVGDQEVAH
jgi:preprotein translocase subunit SecB